MIIDKDGSNEDLLVGRLMLENHGIREKPREGSPESTFFNGILSGYPSERFVREVVRVYLRSPQEALIYVLRKEIDEWT